MNDSQHRFQKLRDFVSSNPNVKEENQDMQLTSSCQFSNVPNGNINSNNTLGKSICKDVSTQTDQYEIAKLVETIVKHRIETLTRSSNDNKVLDKKINAIMRRMFDEQTKLRTRANELEEKLSKYEKAASAAKSVEVFDCPIPPDYHQRRKVPTPNPNSNDATNQSDPSDKNLPQRSDVLRRTQPITSTTKRPPIQMVSPVPQNIRPAVATNSINYIGNTFPLPRSGINNLPNQFLTQVNNANAAPRMAQPQGPNAIPNVSYPPPPNIPAHLQGASIRNNLQLYHQLLNNNNAQLLQQQNAVRWQIQQNVHNRVPLHNIPNSNINPAVNNLRPVRPQDVLDPLYSTLIEKQTLNQPVNTFPLNAPSSDKDRQVRSNQVISVASLDSNKTSSSLPHLKAKISASNTGIILTWDYENPESSDNYKVKCYQLYANQAKDSSVTPPTDPSQWKQIGVVNALPLPMACTLTQIANGNVYHFTVVAVDANGVEGKRSNPCTMRLSAT